MKITTLARRFELKYSLKSEATTRRDLANEAKRELINAYDLYVNPETAKEPILQQLSNSGEPTSKIIIEGMETIVAGIKKKQLSAPALFHLVNNLLGIIHKAKTDPAKTVRNFIHDNTRVTKESEKNYREHLKSKFELIAFKRLSSILDGVRIKLQTATKLEGPAEGAPVDQQRKELSKDKLLMFMNTPGAQTYHLDNMDVMYQILSDPEMKNKLTTLINAISGGHIPVDGPVVAAEAKSISDWLKAGKKTNVPALEKTPEKPAAPVSLFEEE
jgi:hypothetical protein